MNRIATVCAIFNVILIAITAVQIKMHWMSAVGTTDISMFQNMVIKHDRPRFVLVRLCPHVCASVFLYVL